jgi:hypothetical protein
LDTSIVRVIVELLRRNKFSNVEDVDHGTLIALHVSKENEQQILDAVAVGQYHVIIYKMKDRNWVTTEVDVCERVRPKQLTCRVFGVSPNGLIKGRSNPHLLALKTFLTKLLEHQVKVVITHNKSWYEEVSKIAAKQWSNSVATSTAMLSVGVNLSY